MGCGPKGILERVSDRIVACGKGFTSPWKVGREVEGLELFSSTPWSLIICQLDLILGHLKRGNLK